MTALEHLVGFEVMEATNCRGARETVILDKEGNLSFAKWDNNDGMLAPLHAESTYELIEFVNIPSLVKATDQFNR